MSSSYAFLTTIIVLLIIFLYLSWVFVSIKVIHPEHAGKPFIGSTKSAMEKLSKSISGN